MDNYSSKEFDLAYNYIVDKLIKNKHSEEKQMAFILGGQAGAGKSTIISYIDENMLNENAVIISGDDYRKKHPHFKELYEKYGDDYIDYTRKFASEIVETLVNDLSTKKYSLIIEGTMRTYDVPFNTCNLLKGKGYETTLFVIATPPLLSYIGTLKRYEVMLEVGTIARKTTKEQHDIIVKNIVENLDKLYKTNVFDNIVVINREKEILYEMINTPNINPSNILKNELNRELKKDEVDVCIKDVNYVLNSMLERGEEKKAVENVFDIKNKLLKIGNKKTFSKNELAGFVNQKKKISEVNKERKREGISKHKKERGKNE